jgi:predicted molibdopterin-dependent oxidoreductase YjgC
MGINRSRLDVFGAKNDKWNQKQSTNIQPPWWIIKEILLHFNYNQNDNYKYDSAEEVFNDIIKNYNLFNNMNYESLDKQQGTTIKK